jgi:hypothetical protein
MWQRSLALWRRYLWALAWSELPFTQCDPALYAQVGPKFTTARIRDVHAMQAMEHWHALTTNLPGTEKDVSGGHDFWRDMTWHGMKLT